MKLHSPSCSLPASTPCQCAVLDKTDSAKYLGIIIDSHLRWNCQIDDKCKKLKYLIYRFHRISLINDKSISKLLYTAYVQSILQYGLLAWGGAAGCHIGRLFVVQKHIMRAALGKPRLYPSSELFREFDVLTLRQLYIKSLIQYADKNKIQHDIRETPYNLRNLTVVQNRVDLNVCRYQFNYRVNRLINVVPSRIIKISCKKHNSKEVDNWIKTNDLIVW